METLEGKTESKVDTKEKMKTMTKNEIRNYFKDNGLKGLRNLGNTCFLNTALQCFSNTLPLTRYIKSGEYKKKLREDRIHKDLTIDWENMLDLIWEDEKKDDYFIGPRGFVTEVQKIARQIGADEFMQMGDHKDVQEFITFFINTMHESLAEKIPMTINGQPKNKLDKMALQAMKQWKGFFQNDYSVLVDLFYGQTQSRLIADLDPKDEIEYSDTYEPFSNLVLPIPKTTSGDITIYDCLELYSTEENLVQEWKSERDNKMKKVRKKISLWKTPNYLIVVLNRFQNFRGRLFKRNEFIDFPIRHFDLAKYCVGYDRDDSKYELYAVANHSGTMDHGHYYAHCRNLNGNWYTYNDTSVDPITDVDQLVTNNAYCLFYQKEISKK